MEQGIAKKPCDVLPMLDVFHSVVIETPDFEATRADYARLLGRAVDRDEVNDAQKSRHAFFVLSNTILEIRSPTSEEPESREGLWGMRFAGPAIDPLRANLVARGIGFREVDALQDGAPASLAAPRAGGPRLRLERAHTRGVALELLGGSDSGAKDFGVAPRDDRDTRAAGRSPDLVGLDHVVLLSADPDATLGLYRDALGIRLALDACFEERGVRLLFLRLGGVTLEIAARLGGPSEAERPDRFGGLAWKVVGIEALRRRLEAEGFDVSGIRVGHKPGTRVCTVRDRVHGVPTLLIEADA